MERKRLFPVLKRPAPILEALSGQRLLGGLFGGQVGGIDSGLEAMKTAKREEWHRKGYSEGLINMGISLADDWSLSLSEALAPPELRDAVVRHVYPKGLEVASRWLEKMSGRG